MYLKIDGCGIKAVFRTKGVEMSATRGEELREDLGLPKLCGQDVDASESDRGTVDLGEIIDRFSDYLRGETNYRYEDVSKCWHGLFPDHTRWPLCIHILVCFLSLPHLTVKRGANLCSCSYTGSVA